MLESLVAAVLNRVVGSYVKNFDPGQLKIGILGGDVRLRDLELKREALDKFRLPLNVLEGHLGEITLQIPWSNLKNRPVKILIQDVFLLAEPRLDEEYDAEDEERRAQALKRERLDDLEILARNATSLSAEDQQKSQSFTESLINKVVDNLQVTIKNIHFRYEDKTSVPNHPFSVGFTLEELSAVSTDHEWRPEFVQEASDTSWKLATLNRLAIYWNTDTSFIKAEDPTNDEPVSHEELMHRFRSLILAKEEKNQYMLRPVSGVGQLTLNKKPDGRKPKRKLELIFDELGFVLDSDQYRDALWTAELFRLYMKTKDFKRHRPKESLAESPRGWLQYVVTVVKEQISQKRRENDWNYIEKFVNTRNTYCRLYIKKIDDNVSAEEEEELEKLEYDNTFDNIRLFRSIARNQWRKLNKSKSISQTRSHQTTGQAVASVASSWSSWIWGSGSNSSVNNDQSSTEDVAEDTIMTDEQRQELYDAIGWDENATHEAPDIDQNQISLQVDVVLNSGNFRLRRDPHTELLTDFAEVFFNGFKTRFISREASFSTNLSLGELYVNDNSGLTKQRKVVSMTETHFKDRMQVTSADCTTPDYSLIDHKGSEFLYLAFESHPADGKSDSLLYLKTKGVTIHYSRPFIENVARFFQPPKTHLETIGALMNAAGATVEGLRNQTRIGLEYALQEHKTIDLQMDVEAPLIYLPLHASEDSECVVVNAGHISVHSDLVPKETLDEIQRKQTKQYTEKDWEDLENLMYNKFNLQLHNTQVLIGSSASDIEARLESRHTAYEQDNVHDKDNPFDAISSLDLNFLVETSILPEAVNLAKFKVSGKLPLFQLSISDRQYKCLMQIIDQSIPRFDFEPVGEPNYSLGQANSVGLYSDDEAFTSDQELSAETGNNSSLDSQAVTTTESSQKNFVLKFTVDKVEMSLHQCTDDKTFRRKPLVDMVLEKFELEYVLKSLEMTVVINLQSLYIDDFVGHDCENLHKLVSSSSENGDMLFHIEYSRTKENAFSEITDQLVLVELSTLKFVLEPKTSLTILDFIITTFASPIDVDRQALAIESGERQLETHSSDVGALQGQIAKPKPEQDQSTPGIDVRVNMKSVIIQLDDEGIQLATLRLDSAEIAVKLQDETMKVTTRLGNLSLHDDVDQGVPRDSVLRQLISIEGDELADINYETFKPTDKFHHTSSIYFRSGSLRINVVEEPLTRIVSFLSRFNQMKGLFDRARQLALNQAQIEDANRMMVDVILRAPILVFPRLVENENSNTSDVRADTYDVLTAHLGEIYVKSRLEKYENAEDVAYTQVRAGFRQACLISELHVKNNMLQKLELIDKIDISLLIDYIDATEGVTSHPTFRVKGDMSKVEVALTELQLKYLARLSVSVPQIFSGNNDLDVKTAEELAEELEHRKNIEFLVDPSELNNEAGAQTPTNSGPKVMDGPQADLLDFQFTIETISLALYQGTDSVTKESELSLHKLSCFSLNDTGIRVYIDSKSYLTSDTHIHSFTVQDSRMTKENLFTEIIPSVKHGEYQFMCHLSKRETHIDAELTIDSPRVILAVDYLMDLKRFLDHAITQDQSSSTMGDLGPVLDVEDDFVEDVGSNNSQEQSCCNSSKGPRLTDKSSGYTQTQTEFHYHLNVVDLSLIVLADPSTKDSEAIVFKVEQVVLSQRERMTVTLSKIGIFLCQMSQFDNNRLRVLDDFSVTGAIDTRGSDATHEISRILFNIEQLTLRLSLRDVLLALNIVEKASKLIGSGNSDVSTSQIEESGDSTPMDSQYSRFTGNKMRKLKRNISPRRSTVVSSNALSTKKNADFSTSVATRSNLNVSMIRGEQLTANFEGLRFVIIGMSHEIPVVDMCVKAFAVFAENWSSNLRVDMAAESFVNVFNPSKSAWEPLVETWDIGLNMSRILENGNTLVNIFSRKMMEVSLTPQTISLLNDNIDFVSAKSFDESFLLQPRESEAPYIVRNETGYTLEVWTICENPDQETNTATIPDGEQIPWRFYDWHVMRENSSADSQKSMLGIRLVGSSYDDITDVCVTTEGEHIHLLKCGSKIKQRIVCEINLVNQIKNIKFRSTLNIKNWTHFGLIMGIQDGAEYGANNHWNLEPNSSRGVPIQLCQEARIIARPSDDLGFDWSRNSVFWQDLLSSSQTLVCEPDQRLEASSRTSQTSDPARKRSPFYYHVEGDFDKSIQAVNRYPLMTINICAPIEIVNLLPFDFNYFIYNKNERKDWSNTLKRGENSPVHVVQRSDLLLLSVEVAEAGYSRSDFAVVNVRKRDAFSRETTLVTQHKDGQRLHLKIHYADTKTGSGLNVIVYSPYLISNKTGLDLQIEAGRNRALSQVREYDDCAIKRARPKMWSFNQEDDPGNRARIRVSDSKWGEKLSFDALGSAYEVSLLGASRHTEIALGIDVAQGQGKYNLTKIIDISPRFIVKNNLRHAIEFKEPGQSNFSLTVRPNEIEAIYFLQRFQEKQLCVRICGEEEQWSSSFVISNVGRTHVKLFSRTRGTTLLRIDVMLEQATLFLHVEHAGKQWPYSVRNFTQFDLTFFQSSPYVDDQGVEQTPHPQFQPIKYRLPAKSVMSYAWDFPAAPVKELVLTCNKRERRVQLAEIGVLHPMRIPATEEGDGGIIDLSVVADGPVQTLLITDYDPATSMYKLKGKSGTMSRLNQSLSASKSRLADDDSYSNSSGDIFKIDGTDDSEGVFTVKIMWEGVGLSLINRRYKELCYLTLRGLDFSYRASSMYETVSTKIKWIQIDNQLYGGQYEVIVFPSVLPKSSREMENHPTLSASVTRVRDDSYGVLYVKYATVLMQQMTIEMDEDFMLSLMDFARDPEASWAGTEKDVLCDQSLQIPSPKDSNSGTDIYIEALHIQPFQIDLSFMRSERLNSESTQPSSNTTMMYFFNIFTMAIGNINDAPVKLNALLLENVRTPLPLLVQSISTHYTQGFLYQVHKILGSADFLGNPVGLFNNISSGFMDMFYEPYKGFVMSDNPQDLGIGIAKGGLSFVKKSVFGVSDSVSKVTGSISKGLTVATLDREFQNRRRLNMSRNRPKHALYGLTNGATSFVDGVTSGFSGLALAPLEGAAKEGASGFFKGIGKGLIGLPTKTAIGFFDLASNLSEGVRNTTTVFDADAICPIRPPRYIASDGIVRPYNEREAVGQKIMKSANGGLYFNDVYLAHTKLSESDMLVLVTTDRIVMMSLVKGTAEWEVAWKDLREIARRQTGIALTLRRGTSYFIPLANEDSLKFLHESIIEAATEYNRKLQTLGQ